jgi:murein DD-endopeptidase MepM/ murein hydrolase activator NlpD
MLSLLVLPACAGGDSNEAAAPTSAGSGAGPITTTVTSAPPTTVAPPLPAPTTTTADPADPLVAYVFPVEPAEVASYSEAHHDYPATDIIAPCGTVVVAAHAGVVDEVGRVDLWDPAVDDPATRGGLFTSIVGDDGVRYYGSHLASVEPGLEAGVRVEAGQPLGVVGNTGNAEGIECHLHFGLSPPCGPGDWEIRRGVVYPWPYLDSWKAGGSESPAAEVNDWLAANPIRCART